MDHLKKIVVIGPESTGKSTLCRQLAAHYHTEWCPEFAREYLLKHGKRYKYEDLLTIAQGQIHLENEYVTGYRLPVTGNQKPVTSNNLLFIDTDMYVMKVWSEYVFHKCHRYILDQIVERKYDLYLLCNTDIPWVKDELREYPDYETRQKLFLIYKDIMVNQAIPWVEISGKEDERLQMAIAAIDGFLSMNISV